MSQYWLLNDKDQLHAFNEHVMKRWEGEKPTRVKFLAASDAKTSQQVRYAHSLCQSLADYKRVGLGDAKKDAKIAFGVIKVSQSLITGDRAARLLSFEDYSKKEMMGFLKSMEVFLSTEQIPYTYAEAK